MNENTGASSIWKPAVRPTDATVPRPGSLSQQESQEQQQLYTKTSLVANHRYHNHLSPQQSLNRDILNASQAYNNTPKPFMRQGTADISTLAPQPQLPLQKATSCTSSAHCLNQATTTTVGVGIDQQHQQVQFIRQQSQQTADPDTRSRSWSSPQTGRAESSFGEADGNEQPTEEENMAQKLVHNQYNSPIDLYSMNNIRKTIEAHTEMIAPGVKGINFMKPETPVNKQSEVYKLVMEEERAAHQGQQGASRGVSPISGQPLANQSSATMHQMPDCRRTMQHLSDVHAELHARRVGQQQQQQQQEQHHARQEGPIGAGVGSGAPVCCECGQIIKGPFAKIQNRFVHPQCFNCATCGTPLKNVGYFTINEKLYCDIHAKQVANLMQVQYDFGQHSSGTQLTGQSQQQQQQQRQQTTLSRNQEPFVSLATNNNNGSERHYCPNNSAPAATISTMFAARGNSLETTGNERHREVGWTRKSAVSEDLPMAACSSAASRSSAFSSYQRHQQEVSSKVLLSPHSQPVSHQQTLVPSSRGLLQECSLVGGRVPVCINCQEQIQGPYILAGKTVWCKSCSRAHFNCSSCKRSLLDVGFIELDSLQHKYYCELCFEAYYAPICSKCNIRIKGDCLNALGKQWHPSCFVCGHCQRPFGNSSFYLEENVPYCERDWNILFTTKCFSCSYPIEAGDKWIEALERNYHSNCFRCTSCQANLEGSTFYCKGGKPYCRLHAR